MFALRLAVAVVLAGMLLLASEVPAGSVARGVITGSVENAVTGRPQAGVEVLLIRSTGTDIAGRTTVTDRRGNFSFEGLRTGNQHVYSLDARFDGGLFAGGAVTLPSDTRRPPVIETKLRVWPTTRDPEAILVRRHDVFAVLDGTDLGVIASTVVVNRSDKAYIGRSADAEGGDEPTLGFALPTGAESSGVAIVESELDIPALIPSDIGFALTVAIPPGTWKVAFTYELPGAGGSFDLSHPVLYPTLELTVFAAEPLDVESNRLSPGSPRTIGGRSYSRFTSMEPLEAGDPLQVVVAARAELSPLVPVMIAAGALLAVLGIGLVMRRRPRAGPESPAEGRRDDVVRSIAELDIARDAGTISEEEWVARRAALKRELGSPTRAGR